MHLKVQTLCQRMHLIVQTLWINRQINKQKEKCNGAQMQQRTSLSQVHAWTFQWLTPRHLLKGSLPPKSCQTSMKLAIAVGCGDASVASTQKQKCYCDNKYVVWNSSIALVEHLRKWHPGTGIEFDPLGRDSDVHHMNTTYSWWIIVSVGNLKMFQCFAIVSLMVKIEEMEA